VKFVNCETQSAARLSNLGRHVAETLNSEKGVLGGNKEGGFNIIGA
jgi:hypothetical protein